MSNQFNCPLDQQNAGPSSSQHRPKKPKLDMGSIIAIQNKRSNPLLDVASVESKKLKPDFLLNSEDNPFSSGMKYNIHGDAFQVKLLMLCAHRARKNKLFPFKLATEMNAAGVIDDVVFQYENPNEKIGKIWRFKQAKHILNPEIPKNKISKSELKSSNNDNFSLQKYFISFCKIKDNEIFKGDLKDFIIITNTDFKEKTKEWFQKLNDLESDEILGFDNIGAEKYKLNLNDTDKVELKNIFKTKLLESVSNVKGTKAINSIRSKLTKNLALVKNAQFDGLQNLTDMEKQFLDNEKKKLRELKVRILGLDDLNLIKGETKKELLATRLSNTFKEKGITKNSNLIEVKMDLEKRLEDYISEMSIIQVTLDNEKFENYLEDFLNKFYFITNYMSESTLEQRISQEIREEFKLKQVDFLGARFEKGMFDFLKLYIHGKALFCTSDDVDQFFRYLEGQLCMFMAVGLSIGQVNELKNHKIGFNKCSIPETLEKFISNGEQRKILHFSTQTVRLSAIKVLQTINNCAQFHDNDSYLFISLQKLLEGGMETDLKYENTRQMILYAFEMINTCNLLVVECQEKEYPESNNLNELYNEISKILQNQNLSKKIVLISHDDDELLQKIWNDASFYGRIETFSDETSFSDYDDNSKDRIRQRNVVLQNPEHPVQLKLLIDTKYESEIFDQHILSRFLDKMQISIGDQNAFSSRDYDKNYYIERKFHHQIIEGKILKEKSELFFITGINREDLMRMIGESGDILVYEIGQNYEKGIIIPFPSNQSSQDCKEIFESLGEKANWLHYRCPRFTWKGCKRNAKVPNKYVSMNEYSDDLTPLNEDFCRKADESFLQKIIIVANDPGMGKSTVLTSLARKMKMLDDIRKDVPDDRWIVRINLNDHTQKLLQIDENEFNIANAIEFVTEIAVPDDRIKDPIIRFQQNIFKAGLTEIENKRTKIVIMFDGFDEISPRHKAKTTRIIKTLKASQVAQIWVTTRVHEKVHLEEELETPAIILNHLGKDDQFNLFSQFWKWNFKFKKKSNGKKHDKTYEEIRKYLSEIELPNDDYAKQFKKSIFKILNDFPQGLNNLEGLRNAIDKLDLSEYIQRLKDQWEKSLEIGGMQFTVNPLHCRMLAELIFQKKFRLPKEFGLFHMYDEFRKMKSNIYYEEKAVYSKGNLVIEDYREEDIKLSYKLHKALAVELIFYDKSEELRRLLPNLEELRRFEGDEQETEKQKAVRRGFLRLNNDRLEFIHRSFAEYFLSIYLIDNLNNELVQQLLVSEILGKDGFQLIRQFFNDQLIDEKNKKHNEKIKLKGSAKKLLEENTQEKEFHDLILYEIATGNHIGIIKFLFNAIPSDDDLYETLLTTLFDVEYLRYFHRENITKYTIEELLEASSKLDPEIIKCKILHFHAVWDNLLSSAIMEGKFDSSYNHVEVIIKFILKNKNKLGNTFFEQFITRYPVEEAIVTEFDRTQDFEKVQQIINSFRDHLPADIFHKFQAFLVDNELIDLFEFDAECTEWLVEWFGDTPHALNSLLIKYVLKILEENINQHYATDFVEIIFGFINETSKDLAIIFVYSNSYSENDIERLLKAVEHSSKIHQILTSFQTKLHEIKQIHGVLSEKIRIKNINEIKEILEQLNVLQVAAKYNRIGIVDQFLENFKDFPMILEEEINKVGGYGETALLIAARLGHDELFDKLKNALSNRVNRFLELMKKKDTSSTSGQTSAFYTERSESSSFSDHLEPKKDIKNKTNRLNEAIRVGATGKVQEILNKSTNNVKQILLTTNENEKTALHVAAEHNQFEVVQMLFDSIKKQPKIVEEMALKTNFNGETAFHSAVRLGHKQTVEKILDLMKDDKSALEKLLLPLQLKSNLRLDGINHIFSWIKRNLGNFHLIKLILEANSSDWASLFNIVKRYVDLSNSSQSNNPFLERYFHHINDLDILEDLAIFSVYNNAWHDPKKRIAALLNVDGLKTETRQKLREIDSKFDEIKTKKCELDQVVCEGKINGVRIFLPESLIVLKATLLSSYEKGKTALHLAAESNRSEIIEILLEKVRKYPQFLEHLLLKADSFQEDTAMHRAAQLGCHKAVRSLLKFLKNFKNERLSMKTVTKLNGNGKNALEVAYQRKHHQTVKAILKFIDDQSPIMFIDQMKYIDDKQPIWKWTKKNGYAELKQRFLERIGSWEEMKFKLFEAADPSMGDDEDADGDANLSAILTFLKRNKENRYLKELLLECNEKEKTLAGVLVGHQAYAALKWITSHFKHDTKFLAKFILGIEDYEPSISDFLRWLIDSIEIIIPGIINRVLFKNDFPMSDALIETIKSNDFYEAKEFLKLSKKNCSEEIFEILVLGTRYFPDRTILECIFMSENPISSEITDFFKFLFELLENHQNILKKLLLKSDILHKIHIKCTKHPITHEIHSLFKQLKSKYDEFAQSLLDVNPIVLNLSSKELEVLQKHVEYFYGKRNKDDILQKLEEIRSENLKKINQEKQQFDF